MAAPHYRRAFVIGAYIPNGGTYMAYHLGRILELDFGIRAIAVRMGEEMQNNGIQAYDLSMPQIALAQMEHEIRADDILVVNPSFSPHQFGWRLPGFKISYVQDFKTFALLDRGIDHYVAVSDFVRGFLHTVYALDVRVIPPFIRLDELPPSPPWSQRRPHFVLTYRKGIAEVWEQSWLRLRRIVGERAPQIELGEPLAASGIAQCDLFARIAETRHFLTLSAAEGFGLVPLEAMALGSLVVGYDGFGGRHYMRAGDNCEVAPYPQIERVAELLIAAVENPQRSAQMAQRGSATAAKFSYATFRQAWIEEFSRALRLEPIG